MRTTTTLHVKRFAAGAVGAHGNAAAGHGDPVEWDVYGLAPGASQEPTQSNRDLSEIEWTVFAPNNDELPTEKDLVVVDEVEYAVEGRPADWTRGPFGGGVAGVVIELRRAEG